jgi:hypothetical protein
VNYFCCGAAATSATVIHEPRVAYNTDEFSNPVSGSRGLPLGTEVATGGCHLWFWESVKWQTAAATWGSGKVSYAIFTLGVDARGDHNHAIARGFWVLIGVLRGSIRATRIMVNVLSH